MNYFTKRSSQKTANSRAGKRERKMEIKTLLNGMKINFDCICSEMQTKREIK